MKYFKVFGIVLLFAALCIPCLEAQNASSSAKTQTPESNSLKGMSLNGSTGLYSIPTGRIGWERTRDIGFDLGYHTVIHDKEATHIPKIGISLFKWVELNAAFDIQPDEFLTEDKGTDFIGSAKIQFPFTKVAVALGGNFQALNMWNSREFRYKAGQVYAAVTYAGKFFNTPAETTVVVGKTFIEDSMNWDIDFGMGFDIVVFPKYLNQYVHWVTDFSNFSYSVEAFGVDSWYRGVVNTGLRIDLTVIPIFKKFRFVIDIFMTDAFDKDRGFSAGMVFGVPIL